MTDIAVVGIQLRTDEVERGAKVVVKAFGNMAAAREKESVAARIATQAERQAVQAVEQAARAYSTAGVSSLEFTRALKQMGAVGPAVTEEINRNSAAARANAQAAKLAADAQRQTAEAVKTADVATTRATPGLKSLQTNLGSLAIAAGGLPGPLGRTAQALSTFALGGGPAVAIIAGISAIAFAYNQITEPARRAREETDKLIESLNRARDARFGLDIQKDMAKATADVTAAMTALDRARQGTTVAISSGGGAYTGPRINEADITKAEERVFNALRAVAELRDRTKEFQDQGTAGVPPVVAGVDRITSAHDELGKAIERNIARISRLTYGKPVNVSDALTPEVIGGQGFSLGFQTRRDAADRVRNSPLLTPAAIASSGKEVETRLSAAYDEAARNFQRGLTSAIEGVITGAPDLGKQLGQAIVGGMAGVLTAALTDAVSKSMASKVFMDGVKNGVGGLSALFQSQKIGNLGSAIAGGAIGYSSGNAATGALGGAASGFALGGPAGAIVGGIAGIVGGLLGSSKQAAEAARQMEEARKAFGLALDAFTAEAFGTATNLSRNIANANRLGDELKGNAPKPVLASADADDVRRFRKELEDYVATLGKVDEATAAYITRLQEEEETRLQMINLSLEEREARLAGNDRGALEARAAREQAEVQRQLRNGEITAAIAARTSAVIDGELAQAIADLGKDAEEAARQIEEANASFATSLVGRELQARARLATSDAEREGIEDMIRAEQYRLEIEAAVKDGISETNIAALKRIQGLEEEAVAMERSKKAEEDRLRIIKESTAFLDDLKVREFRATGQGAAADEYAQRERDRQELIKAAEFGADYVMETLRVQGLERADRDAQRRAQQEAAFGNSFGTTSTSLLPDSRTSVNLAVGTSESTTNRLVGVMQSQLIHIQATASNTAEAAVLLRRIAASLDGGVTAIVDEGLAIAGSDADLGAGVVPGNR